MIPAWHGVSLECWQRPAPLCVPPVCVGPGPSLEPGRLFPWPSDAGDNHHAAHVGRGTKALGPQSLTLEAGPQPSGAAPGTASGAEMRVAAEPCPNGKQKNACSGLSHWVWGWLVKRRQKTHVLREALSTMWAHGTCLERQLFLSLGSVGVATAVVGSCVLRNTAGAFKGTHLARSQLSVEAGVSPCLHPNPGGPGPRALGAEPPFCLRTTRRFCRDAVSQRQLFLSILGLGGALCPPSAKVCSPRAPALQGPQREGRRASCIPGPSGCLTVHPSVSLPPLCSRAPRGTGLVDGVGTHRRVRPGQGSLWG